jgi:hypothetical protein
MKILEVAFDDYVRRPESQHNTNILRVTHENALGTAALVDELTEDAIGIKAVKMVEKEGKVFTYRSRYPWNLVKDVKYEVEVMPPVVETKKK